MSKRNLDALLLCGGFGTRLQSVLSHKPKPLADFNDRPFLDLLIDYVAGYGFRRFLLCAGHKGDQIENYFSTKQDDRTYAVSLEPTPLGTAGAVKFAEPLIQSNPFLAMNGDSFCQANLDALLDFHFSKDSLVTIAVTQVESTQDYGGIQLAEDGEILGFDEKNPDNPSGWVNAGIYVFDRAVLDRIPTDRPCSLEKEVFPDLVHHRFFGYITDAPLLDIGTPERLERARKILLSSN